MEENKVSVLKAVRLKCLDCSCGSAHEVSLCPIESCPLFPFRFGKNPFRAKREMSDEQRAAAKERLAKSRKRKAEEGDRGLPE